MVRLRTLGGCVIHVGDVAVGPEAERLFGVLLYLVTERGRRVARRALQDLLWPEASEENGRHNLRQAIYKLRQAGVELGGGNRDVQLHADQVAHDPFDVLGADAATAGDALLGGQLGEYLAGYSPTFSQPYAAWVEAQRAYAHARVARAAVGAMLERRARGRWDEVERLAQICLRYDPLNEEATLALAEANALAGSKARALAILDQYIAELGDSTSIQLPATLLRRRIAERLPDPAYTVPSEASFAGRDESLRYLHELFGHARAGRGQSCMLVGEPGVGKTRLAAEFARVATLQGAQVHHMGCHARDRARPLALFVDGVAALLKLPGAIGCSPRSMSYLKRIIEFDPTAGGASDDSREADQLYASVRGSVLDLLDAICAERTLLLVIDDVHWADAASWDVLRDMIAWVRGRRVLLVLTSRVAQVPSAELEQMALRMHHLAPLDRSAATHVLAALLGERQRRTTDAQHDWLLRAANGNPLFIRELAIHWLETGREGAVPPSLSALMHARLARLSPLGLRVFQTCAIMGPSASFERLEVVLQYKRHEVLDGLQELEAAGLLHARAGGVHSRHELLADAAAGQLTGAARAYVHRQIAATLEPGVLASLPGDTSLLWACATHWRAAGEPEHGTRVARSCAAHLLEIGRPTDAIDVLTTAADAATTSADVRTCKIALVDAFVHAGRWADACELLGLIEAADDQQNVDRQAASEVCLRRLEAETWMGADLPTILMTCKSYTRDTDISAEMRVQFAIHGLRVADFVCATAEISELWEEIEPMLHRTKLSALTESTASMIYHATLGSLDDALRAATTALAERRKLGSAAGVSRGLRSLAYISHRCGRHDDAMCYLRDAVALSEEHNLVTDAGTTCGIIAERLMYDLHLREARTWHDRATSWLRRAASPASQLGANLSSAKLAIMQGRMEDAAHAAALCQVTEPRTSDFRRRMEQVAVALHLRLGEGRDVLPVGLIDELVDSFAAARSLGDQDYAAIVLFMVHARNDPAQAREQLRHFVEVFRRERGTPPLMILNALKGADPFAAG